MHSGSSEYLNNYLKDLLWIYYECYTKNSEISLALQWNVDKISKYFI